MSDRHGHSRHTDQVEMLQDNYSGAFLLSKARRKCVCCITSPKLQAILSQQYVIQVVCPRKSLTLLLKIQSEQELLAKVNEQIQQILNDIDGAVNYVLAGENEHPNRRDMCQVPASGSTTTAANSFSNPTSTNGGFGQPSGLGATATSQPAFGAPSFGKPASPFAGAAQPSAFGQPSLPEGTSAFGKPSLPGQGGAFGQLSVPSQTSAFGQPSAPGQGSAFGQPSAPRPTTAFGQPSAPSTTSAFGQPSAPGTTSAFGQPSAPGTTSAFGRPSAPVASGAFGQPSLPGQTSAFGQPSQPTSAFGQPTNPAPSPFAQAGPGSAFGQPSQSNQPSPFAQPVSSQPSSGFGQPSSVAGGTTAGAFGRPSTAFGQPSQPQSNNPFATKPAETQPTPSPFGQPAQTNSAFGQPSGAPAFAQPSQPTPSPFAQPAASSQPSTFGAPPPTTSQPTATITNGTGSTGTPDPSTYIQKGPNNSIRSFKNQPVSYIDRDPHYRRQDDRTQERIWFPEGPPGLNKYTEEPQAVYEAVGPTLKDAYDFLAQTGTFKDGMMPEFAPKREWVRFDL